LTGEADVLNLRGIICDTAIHEAFTKGVNFFNIDDWALTQYLLYFDYDVIVVMVMYVSEIFLVLTHR
jgi:hypothetical protein